MTTIYLMRHGRTEWNKDGIFRGRIDVPLDDLGKQQALCAGKSLRGTDITAAYSSPLSRAMETARLCLAGAECGLDVVEEPGLIDLCFGEWEGKSVQQVKMRYPDSYYAWENNPEVASFPGGESLDEAAARAWRTLERLVSAHLDDNILLVTHRVICKLLLGEVLGSGLKAFWRIRQDTACINILQKSASGYLVKLVNDTCHLPELSKAYGPDS